MSMVMHHSVALRRGNTRRNSDDFLLSLDWLAASLLESVLMLVRVMMLHLSTVMDADVGIDCSLQRRRSSVDYSWGWSLDDWVVMGGVSSFYDYTVLHTFTRGVACCIAMLDCVRSLMH